MINPQGSEGVTTFLVFKRIPQSNSFERFDEDRFLFTDLIDKRWEIMESSLTTVNALSNEALIMRRSPLAPLFDTNLDEAHVNRYR